MVFLTLLYPTGILPEKEFLQISEEAIELFVLDHQRDEHLPTRERERFVHVRRALSKVEPLGVLLLVEEEVQFVQNELVDEVLPRSANQSASDSILHREGVQNF